MRRMGVGKREKTFEIYNREIEKSHEGEKSLPSRHPLGHKTPGGEGKEINGGGGFFRVREREREVHKLD
ncbi:hypothetical protein RHMOL_Rhmol06G0065700 [Rhododendron molle]|uniref:Uncharacterized protein n=1 Tax=Rhododendron molle TaxID=49168 RepID=A0ACC0N9V0_RHOML|nr:hypothetical protein RHMOL_Rhmol06G0065700 [Rhododendron molle]